jgi:hypothetical protein
VTNFTDNDIQLTEHADESTSTHVLMEVEDYDSAKRHSYIRLGAVPSAIKTKYDDLDATGNAQSWDSATGEDLASLVTTFIDDTRYRGDSTSDKFYTNATSERQAETDLLHTKGGWRDHTDGNRVTTTRGDKIEVIRGNYKMRVLGRSQWNNDKGSGLHAESSGGITYQYDEVPGQFVDVRWSDDDGTWRVFEECEHGHVINRYHGVMKEWSRGGDVVDRVGSPDGAWRIADADFDLPTKAAHKDSDTFPVTDSRHKVSEEIYASRLYEKTICQDYARVEYATKVDELIAADTLNELAKYDTYTSISLGLMAVELWGGVFVETFNGQGISMKIGLFTDIRAGGACEANAALGLATINIAQWNNALEASLGWTDGYLAALALECDFGAARLAVSVNDTKVSIVRNEFFLAFFCG